MSDGRGETLMTRLRLRSREKVKVVEAVGESARGVGSDWDEGGNEDIGDTAVVARGEGGHGRGESDEQPTSHAAEDCM